MANPQAIRELESIVGPDGLLQGRGVEKAYDCDAYTVDKSAPSYVVLPRDTREVQKIVQWCLEHSIPFTPRGAGTGLSGGAMPALGGVVVSTKRMTQVLKVDAENRCLLAQTGIPNIKISQAVAHLGLHFAPDPSSQSVSTLGGNIAENSGGPHTLKYGVTAQHILQMTLVDNAGEVRTIGSRLRDEPGEGLVSLVVGSEGTLGIVTEAWVNLVPIPNAIGTVLVSFDTVEKACNCVNAVIVEGVIPAALEMMDHFVLKAVSAAFGLHVPEGTAAMLLIECDGETEVVAEELARVKAVCHRIGVIEIREAQTSEERAKLWMARKKGIGAMGRLAPTIVTHDGVIPRSKLPQMLELVYRVAQENNIGVANIFHAGDGNLHPCFYFDDREPGVIERVIHAGEQILEECIRLGGSVSGEHGIGLEKSSMLPRMFGEAGMELQIRIQGVLPQSPFANPCKVIPNQKGCVEHMRRWRGVAT